MLGTVSSDTGNGPNVDDVAPVSLNDLLGRVAEGGTSFRQSLAGCLKTSARGARTQAGPAARELRDWARSNGLEVPDRGRIPASIREAFEAAS